MNLISCSDSVSAGLLTLLMEDWSAAMDWNAVNWTMKAAETTTTFFMMRANGDMALTHSRKDAIVSHSDSNSSDARHSRDSGAESSPCACASCLAGRSVTGGFHIS